MQEGITRLTYREIEDHWLRRVRKIYEGMNETKNIQDLIRFLEDPQYTVTFRYSLCRFLRDKYGTRIPGSTQVQVRHGSFEALFTEGTQTPLEEEVEAYITLMQTLAAERGMAGVFQGKHLRLYLKGKQENVSRETLFKMAFAFDMDTDQVCQILEAMNENPYNFRDPRECIFYFCQYDEKTNDWTLCQRLLEEWENREKDPAYSREKDVRAGQSSMLQEGIEALHYDIEDPEERSKALMKRLYEEQDILTGFSRTAYETAYRLMDELKECTGAEDDTALAIALWEPVWVQYYTKKADKTGVNRSDFVPWKDLLDLPKVVYEKPLWRARIQKLRAQTIPVEKRDILFMNCMLWALEGDTGNGKETMNEFLLETNGFLLDAGLSVVYPPNPYDRMMLLAVCSESPFDVLSDIFQTAADEEKLQQQLDRGEAKSTRKH